MKDYKQKHKEDFQEAKSWLTIAKENNNKLAIQILENLFPELKESEERIREEIIDYLKGFIPHHDCDLVAKSKVWIAWLEKQGKKTNLPQDTEDDLRRQSTIRVLEYARSLDAYNQYGKESINKDIAWLKKQGEMLESIKHKEAMFDCQTCANYENECFPDKNIFKCSYPIKYSGRNLQDVLEKQGEQEPVNEVGPKFNIGDWLQYRNAKPFLVEEITKQGYVNGDSCLPFNWENEIHLWTIQDAKDGNVLVASDGSIFILKEIVDCGCKHYIALEKDSGTININDNLEHFWEAAGGVKPATKEQQDLLFSKMKEAGYEWDSEKKELKIIDWSKHIKYNPNTPSIIEENSAWSEEDERMLQKALSTIRYALLIPIDDEDDPCFAGSSTISWLKSLKDRVKI